MEYKDNPDAVMTALSGLVNCEFYGEKPFFASLPEITDKYTARQLLSCMEQLCQALGTTLEAELNKPRGARYEPLRYRAIPEGDPDRALAVAIGNVLVASTDLERMLRNKQLADMEIRLGLQ